MSTVEAVTFSVHAAVRPHGGNIPLAVLAALLSTTCYATSAVLQQREASRPGMHTSGLVRQLVRRPWWWAAVLAALAAAALHIAALALGPLTLVQPIGVLTLVMALPLGARLARRTVAPREWRAAVAVALGLAAVLTVAPHHAPATRLSVPSVLSTATTFVVVVLLLVGLATRLPPRAAPVMRAAAAATCFGFASGMTRVAATGAAPFLVAGAVAVLGAAAGLALAQLAYRHGGLGAPLATQILVDPIVAVIIGIVLLKEPVLLNPGLTALGVAGLITTVAGILVLARTTPLEMAAVSASDEAR